MPRLALLAACLLVAPAARAQPASAPGGIVAVPAPASRVRIEPLARSRTEIRELAPGGIATTAPEASSMMVERLPEPGPSRVAIRALAPSRVRIEALAGSDAVLVQALKSELNARETERGTVISLPGDVLFDFDKWDIRPDARPTLAKLAELIRCTDGVPALIEGHTDAKGGDAYNLRLSERRARAVADWLAERHGIERARLREAGLGEARPVAPNTKPDGRDDPEGRQRNRRVEVILARG